VLEVVYGGCASAGVVCGGPKDSAVHLGGGRGIQFADVSCMALVQPVGVIRRDGS